MALLSPLALEDYLRLSFGVKSSSLVLFYNEHIKNYIEIVPTKLFLLIRLAPTFICWEFTLDSIWDTVRS